MTSYRAADHVRVKRLDLLDGRYVESTARPPQIPRVGETGQVVADCGDGRYYVERLDETGGTVWIAELLVSELEAVAEP